MARVPAAERRNDFVNAAIHVIAAHGVDGATTRRIADQANAPLATLHYCFDSKEDLFAAVFEKVAEQYRNVVVDNDVHDDVATTACAILRGLTHWYLVESADFASATVELLSWAQRQHGNPAIPVYNEALNAMRSILKDAASSQDISSETIDEISYVIAALSDGFAVNWLVYADSSEATRQADIIVDVLDTWLAAKLA